MNVKKCLLALCSILVIVSCSNDFEEDKNISSVGKPMQFSSSIVGQEQGISRVTGTSWSVGDAIGVFMIKGDEVLSESNILSQTNNIKHETNGNGMFIASNLGEGIIFPSDETSADFVAYYPYSAILNNFNVELNIANQENKEKLDFMYSNNAKGCSEKTDTPQLEFARQLSMLRLEVSSQSAPDLSGLSAKVCEMATKAKFDLANGNLMVDSGSIETFDVPVEVETEIAIVEIILLPQTIAANEAIQLRLASGETYTWKIPDGTQFKAGERCTYQISLKS